MSSVHESPNDKKKRLAQECETQKLLAERDENVIMLVVAAAADVHPPLFPRPHHLIESLLLKRW